VTGSHSADNMTGGYGGYAGKVRVRGDQDAGGAIRCGQSVQSV